MAYAALTAFLTEPIAQREDIPDSEKTPEYWAERLGREWYGLPAEDVAAKLLPFFREFNRLCEAEKAQAARIKALETALEPFAAEAEGYEDWAPDDQGGSVKLFDLRRARSVLSEKQS